MYKLFGYGPTCLDSIPDKAIAEFYRQLDIAHKEAMKSKASKASKDLRRMSLKARLFTRCMR